MAGVVGFAVALLAVASFFGTAGSLFIWLLLVPGIIGGSIAMAIRLVTGHPASSSRPTSDVFAGESTLSVINMSRIRVAGIGGLGFVGIALVIAWVFPRIGDTVLVGAVGGIVAAALVIVYRRRGGPLSSSGRGIGGRTMLVAGDDDDEPTPSSTGELAGRSRHEQRMAAVSQST